MRPWMLYALVLIFLQATSTSSSRTVFKLDPETINIEDVKGKVNVVIERMISRWNEGCEIEMPDGTLWELTEDFQVSGVRALVPTSEFTCGVEITASMDIVGQWWLISNETDLTSGGSVQRRLPIIVHAGVLESESTTPVPSDTINILPTRVINIEDVLDNIEIYIPKESIQRTDRCEIRTPDGELYELTEAIDINGIQSIPSSLITIDISCGIVVNVSDIILGEWVLIARETNWLNDSTVDTKLPIVFREGYVEENTTTEDPPSVDINKLDNKVINTEIGETFEVTLIKNFDHETELCQIVKPDGKVYDFGIDIPGVTEQFTHESCSVAVTVMSEDFVGQWKLIAKEHKMLSGTYVETRLPFQVVVERSVQAIPQSSVTVQENSNFHLRLAEPTDMYQTCRLVPPNEKAVNRIQHDQSATNSCAYIISAVSEEDSGEWEIVYGNNILYKASVVLTVIGSTYPAIDTQVIHLTQNAAVNMEVGPENAAYCRLEDPNGVVVFDGFGRCILSIDRVPTWYNGHWTMTVGLPGKVIAETHLLYIFIDQAEPRPEVQTSVAMSHGELALTVSCSVETSSTPQVCKFRDPRGRILVAQEGVGEDKYSFHGTGISSVSGKYIMDCGLRISSPGTEDLGIWRCGVETEDDTHYGFLLVTCPWLMNNETVAATIETDPVLRPRVGYAMVTSGDVVDMSCTIPSIIRYCYFRSENGTIFTVSPGVSNDVFEYLGNGFEAGECGLRLKEFTMADVGKWTCNVGLNNGSTPEQSADINLYGSERMLARLRLQQDHSVMLTAFVGMEAQIDYCRFIRSDGLGFTNEFMAEGYVFTGILSARQCDLRIARPREVDFRSWIVAAGITGQQSEVMTRTQPLQINIVYGYSSFFLIRLTLLIISISLLFLSLSLLFGTKKNRRWTYARATAVRESFRRSFRRAPPLETKNDISSPQAA